MRLGTNTSTIVITNITTQCHVEAAQLATSTSNPHNAVSILVYSGAHTMQFMKQHRRKYITCDKVYKGSQLSCACSC